MEIVFLIGAFVLLIAIIYGTLSYRKRDKAAEQAGEAVVTDRYERDET
ncbi:MAG: hypothetical protein JOY90_34350 [Bradyrhizobium sp.]|nr:hypothetical protein [Bradyrhizobium sp.]MBV9565496.1 hypothetical protein [Bradyrhizobium sp.]